MGIVQFVTENGNIWNHVDDVHTINDKIVAPINLNRSNKIEICLRRPGPSSHGLVTSGGTGVTRVTMLTRNLVNTCPAHPPPSSPASQAETAITSFVLETKIFHWR